MSKKVLMAISNGFEDIEAIAPIDIMRRASIEVTIAAVEDLVTTSAHNVKITADTMISEVKSSNYDMMVLPGGLPNAFTLADDENVQRLLKEFKSQDKNIGAICAAPYALHKAEVLNENYTCYPSFEQKIKDSGYHSDKDFVIDGKVITSRGPGTATTFGLEIVRILCGDEVSNNLKSGMLL